ncbi:MAG: hypothetical protein J5J00_09705 [Deltaproteobacteria bacterium]|nr:hypothetical protein [Deltaproteobacteria bacterium]
MIGAFNRSAAFCILTGTIFALVFSLQLPVAQDLDFFPVYGQVLGMLNGIPFYNESQLYEWLSGRFPTLATADAPPLAQPPWYFASLFFLGFFGLPEAAKIWFSLNLSMLIISALIITKGGPLRVRAAAAIIFLTFPPAIGHNVVGQFTMPVLLGTALGIEGVRSKSPWCCAAAMFLCTYKPHIGLPIAWAILMVALFQGIGKSAALRALWLLAAGAALGFLADSNWLLNYSGAVLRVKNLGQNVSCDTCISFTYALSSQEILTVSSAWIFSMAAGALTLVASAWLAYRTPSFKGAAHLIAASGLIGLLLSPYVRNYDMVAALPAMVIPFLYHGWRVRTAVVVVLAVIIVIFYDQPRGAYQLVYPTVLTAVAAINAVSCAGAARKMREIPAS